MTLLLFIFAEVTPKTFAIKRTDNVALVIAPVIGFLGKVLGPLANALLRLANVLMPGKGLKEGPYITEQELRASAEVASSRGRDRGGGEGADPLHLRVRRHDRARGHGAAPRHRGRRGHCSRFATCRRWCSSTATRASPCIHEDLDDVVGVVFAKDVLKALHQGTVDMPLADIVRQAHYVPESKKVADLLREMQREKFHQALVTDEYGSVTGIVALEDLLEELVGEITDEYDVEEPEMVEVGDGVYRVSGKTSIDDLNDMLGTALPDEEWDTVGGLVLDIFGKIPDAGEEADFQGLRFRAEEVQGRRVATVVITRVPVEVARGRRHRRWLTHASTRWSRPPVRRGRAPTRRTRASRSARPRSAATASSPAATWRTRASRCRSAPNATPLRRCSTAGSNGWTRSPS